MSSIFKHKKLIIFIVFIAVFSILVINKNRLSFLTTTTNNKSEYNLVQEEDKKIKIGDDSYVEGVTFDVYFLKDIDNDGEADGLRGAKIETGKSEKLYFDLNISGDKKIKDATLTFVNENVRVGGTLAKSSVIPSNMSNTDFRNIALKNDIGTGISSFFYLNVTPYVENDLNKFSGTNKVIFKGTIVDNITGEETPFEKEITYNVDTYATNIGTSIYSTASSNPENVAKVTYTVEVQENYGTMPMKASYLTGSVADFEGRHPTSVTVKSADNSNIEFNYDSDTQTFTAVKTAQLDENNVITKQAYNNKNGNVRYNKWVITVTYPTNGDEVLDNKVTTLNVKAWTVGYTDENLTEKKSNEVNRVISHTLTVRPYGNQIAFSDNSKINIGTYAGSIEHYFVDKTFLENVYLGQETNNFRYKEEWDLNSSTDAESSLLYSETGDKFTITQSMHDFTTYKTLKVINTPNVANYKLIIKNADTNEIIHIIDSENVEEEFEFPQDVRKISIETNKIGKGVNFRTKLSFVKEIDSAQLTNSIPIISFASYGSITNSGTVCQSDISLDATNPFNGNATFSETYSNARLTSSTTSYSRTIEEPSIPMTYVIKHNNVDVASKLWSEGYYLIKLPKEIIDVDNLKVTVANYVVSKEVVEIDGNKFIKIINDFSNLSNNMDITVKFDAVINPKASDCSGNVELYAINNTATLYNYSQNDIYDLNGNGSTTDKAAYSSVYITITAPNELLTGSIITDYDDAGSETVSPLIADVNPLSGSSDANVDVFLLNNSSFKIKNIELVGKLAYQGNKYEGLTASVDLGSEYDVYLSGPIQIPAELEGKVTIYYTTEENPSRDINDTTNGWTTTVTDYSAIKTYMIKFDDSIEMSKGKSYDFVFPIDMPSTTANLLKKTYFNHGVYFNRVTDAGTVSGKVTAPKLGVRMARIYDLDLDVYRSFSENKVTSGKYILEDEDGNRQTLSLDSNGHALLNGLYVNKEYKLIHYSTPSGYVLDKEEKTFKIVNQNDDSLGLVKDGTYRKINYTNDNVLEIDLDTEILYSLDLHNIDSESNVDIKDSVFKVKGKNYEAGTNITTNSSGHAYLNNLVLGEVYSVEQIKVYDYSIINSFNFKIDRDPNTHEVKLLIESFPEIVKSNDCDALFLDVNTDYSGYLLGSNSKYGSLYSRLAKCNYTIDLTDYSGTFSINGYANLTEYMYGSSYNPYAKLSLVKDLKNTLATPFLTLQKSTVNYNSYYVSSYFTVNNAYEKVGNDFDEVNIQGGNIYNLYVEFQPTSVTWSGGNFRNGYVSVSSFQIKDVSGKPSFVRIDEKENVNPKYYGGSIRLSDNTNVTQTLKNYSVNDTTNPLLELEVKNKYITKATLEITKIDGETEEKLSGAQFKITGPGLPDKGKYITIGEDGKGSTEIYLSYEGSTSYIPGMNNNYPLQNTYTIQEAIPPKGYSLNSDVVTFRFTADTSYNRDTGELSYTYKLKYDMGAGISKFKDYEIDSDNKVLKTIFEDFPIVKVTKTDEETGEILPNTYYAVYKITRENGNEYTEFAKDSDGNYIGEKLTVDGEQFYVVKTDENGSFTLNIPSGQYQLKEIQAADEKYEISDQIIYFGVGETIPYQDAGLTLKRGLAIPTSYPPNERNAKIYPTDDGGYITIMIGSGTDWSGPIYIIKYDTDFNVQWFKTYISHFTYKYNYLYFDDPDRVDVVDASVYTDSYMYYYAFKEYDDGYYLGLDYNDIIKIDKDTGDILYESGIEKSSPYEYTYTEYCDKNNYTPPDYQLNPDYPDKYYCRYDTYVAYNYWAYYDYEPHMYFADDGYVYVISKISNDGNYGFKLKDGTRIIPTKGDLKAYYSYYLLKMDLEGNVIEANNLSTILHDAHSEFIDEYLPDLEEKVLAKIEANRPGSIMTKYDTALDDFNMTYTKNEFKILPNGDICFVISASLYNYTYQYTYTSNGQEYTNTSSDRGNANIVVRMDKDLNVKYYVPIGYRGNEFYIGSDSNYVDNSIIFNDDGSFEYAKYTYYTMGRDIIDVSNDSPYYGVDNYIYSNVYNDFDPKIEEGHYRPPYRDDNGTINHYSNHGYSAYAIFKWDSNGMADDWVELARGSKYTELYDTTNDFKRMYNYNNYLTIVKLDDGYIVGAPQAYQGYTNTYDDLYRTVELASGEVVVLDPKTTYTLYKVNNDSSVEWVKQYGNVYTNRSSFDTNTILKDNKFAIYKLSTSDSYAQSTFDAEPGELVTSVNDPTHAKISGSSSFVLLEFELLDEVTPEAPEATSLNLTNRRKEYKINITNNEGGTFDITSDTGEVLYQGSEPGTIETVKHGDDSISNIRVTANPGYEIKEITVNGEPASYTVNDDGSIVIDKFTAVTEEKNINVTFERGMSRVVVHHYLKGTTTKIDSDELLTGRIESDYTTEAKTNKLYSLVKDENGEIIIPSNYKGKYTINPIEVTYYYEVNMVDLRINFYKNNTEESLAQTIIEQHELGFEYFAEAAQIPHYKVVNVLGNEHGTMDDDLTEVTYFYDDASTGTVTIKHISNVTGLDIVNPITKVIEVGATYETEPLNPVPGGYEYVSRTDNYRGSITEENQNITVIYYYDVIKSNVITKHIDATTREEIAPRNVVEYNYGDNYTTSVNDNIRDKYRVKSTPENASGIVYENDITVVYEYDRIKSYITVRYLDPETEKDVTPPKQVIVNLGDEYTTEPLKNVPKGYKLKEIPANAKGIADSENIEVVYYYQRLRGVKDITDTGDNIIKFIIISLISTIGILSSIIVVRKNKKKV